MIETFKEAHARFYGLVEQGLEGALSRAIGEDHLREMLRAHLGAGGKRLRALVPLWLHVNRGGAVEDVMPLAVGIELLHNATLVHDDLQDGDTHRRGQPTVWRRFGSAQAINAGDALYFAGMSAILEAPAGARVAPAVSTAMTRVIEGQVQEFRLQAAPDDPAHLAPSLQAWTRMARAKTGALFGAAFQAGFAAGSDDATQVDAMAAHGRRLGWAFQVQDDLLDLVGDKGRARRATDLAEGKLSFPAVWALEHGPPQASARLGAILREPRASTTDSMLTEGLALLEGCGAIAATIEELITARDDYAASPCAAWMPDLMTVVLRPVAHVLG
jgi:geranylgeranyl pyrophosphate synthase